MYKIMMITAIIIIIIIIDDNYKNDRVPGFL